MTDLRDDIEEVLYTEEQIRTRIHELGRDLSEKYEGKNPLFVGVLKGCFVFMSDLLREITVPRTVDFMAVSSYGNATTTTGAVKINKDLSEDIEGRHVVIVEDILDSGVTLSYLSRYLMNRNPASLSIVTLFDKPEGRKTDIRAEMYGYLVPNKFIVGYGLDYAERYRNLPYIGVLKPEIYE